MRESERRRAAIQFAETWRGRGYEKGESQAFWLGLLRDVFGVAQPEDFIAFEEKVLLDKTSFIDAVIPSTHVLIEQALARVCASRSSSLTAHTSNPSGRRSATLPSCPTRSAALYRDQQFRVIPGL